jgi:hypothetical protein
MPLLDFHTAMERIHPTLDPALAAAVLGDSSIHAGPLPLSQSGELTEALRDLQRAAAAAAARLDKLTVTVSAPLVIDRAKFVAGVLFRRAHDVVPSWTGTGQAVFGAEHFEDGLPVQDPPFDGAVTEVEFSPPRPQTRYLIEFLCSGDSINIQSSDGVVLQANGPSSVVYHSTNGSVTYSISSPGLWHFFGCTISWLSA